MNQLRSWLYGHHVSVLDKHTPGADLSQSSSIEGEGQTQERSKHMENVSQSDSYLSVARSTLLKVIPLAPGDCLECKLVGTSVMMLSGAVVLASSVSARKRNPKLAGLNGTVYLLLCSSLFVGFQAAAFCRLFDVGPFEKYAGISVTERKPWNVDKHAGISVTTGRKP